MTTRIFIGIALTERQYRVALFFCLLVVLEIVLGALNAFTTSQSIGT